jgi:hypothetical protein
MFAALLAVTPVASPAAVEDSTPKNFIVSGFALGSLSSTAAVIAGAILGLRYHARAGGCGIDLCAELGSDAPYWGVISASLGTLLLIALPAVFEGFRELIQASSRGPG